MSETIRCQFSSPRFLLSQFIMWASLSSHWKLWKRNFATRSKDCQYYMGANFCGSTLWEQDGAPLLGWELREHWSVVAWLVLGAGCAGASSRLQRLVGCRPKPPPAGRTLAAAAYAWKLQAGQWWRRRSQAINDIAHLLLTGQLWSTILESRNSYFYSFWRYHTPPTHPAIQILTGQLWRTIWEKLQPGHLELTISGGNPAWQTFA